MQKSWNYEIREGMNIPRKLRNSIKVPHVLAFKENVPVLLAVNLSEKLVNGPSGYVKSLATSSVIVYFTRLKESKEIAYFDCYRHSHHSGHNVFIGSQIPLILSFPLTIHRSQGMTCQVSPFTVKVSSKLVKLE